MIKKIIIKSVESLRANNSNNLAFLIKKLVALFKLKISEHTIKKSLLNHPDYPSIKSITDSFQEWNISNIVVKISVNDLSEIPYPSLAQVTNKNKLLPGNYFVLLIKQIKDEITYYEVGKGMITEVLHDFSERWEGVLILIKFNKFTGEYKYKKNLMNDYINKFSLIFKFLSISVLILSTIIYERNILISYLINIFGVIISFMLLKVESEGDYMIKRTFCEISNKISCLKVLNSKASKLLGIIEMSEVGIVYFLFNLISLSFSIIYRDNINILSQISFITLFYTFFSLYYQGVILKSWCLLCTSIQIILWINFLTLIGNNNEFHLIYEFSSYKGIFWAFLLSTTVWLYLRKVIINGYKYKPVLKKLISIKSNQEVFETLLKSEHEINIDEVPKDLMLGDKEANNYVLLISDLFCLSCSEAYREIKELLNYRPKNLKIILCFYGDDKINGYFSIIANTILSIKEDKLVEEALDDWYKFTEKNEWLEKYKKYIKIDVEDLLEKHIEFCKNHLITRTPSIYFNGYLLPQHYSINDLKYIVE